MEMKIAIFIICSVINFSESPLPDLDKSVTKLIEDYGYLVETHHIKTKDGYILSIHRIPGLQGENLSNNKTKSVVFMMHGLLGSSADWVVTGTNTSLAFLLVQNGYDVWLGNNRGNTFSKNHISYLSGSYGFWNFSYHELGIYDLPAMIDHTLQTTKMKDLHYVCFSQGCTELLVMASLKPEYNKKVRLAITFAPAAYMKHAKGLALFAYPIVTYSKIIADEFGYFEFLPRFSLFRIITNYLCRKGSALQDLCFYALFLVLGIGTDEIDRNLIGNALAYFPAGCSWKQIIHFFPIRKEIFAQYDYGFEENLRLYNSSIPPEYPLRNVKIPITIFYTVNDFLSAPEDVSLLIQKLPNVVGKFLMNGRRMNHMDFIYGRNIRKLVYNRVLQLIHSYSKV